MRGRIENMKARRYYPPESAVCPVCGKMFVPTPEHRYVLDRQPVCTWGCLCRGRKNEVKPRCNRQYDTGTKVAAVTRVLKDGLTCVAAAKEVGCHAATVSVWLREYADGKFDDYIKERGL